jgi:glutamate N-acetyltransferase/amino-acid N-acetyltransferase
VEIAIDLAAGPHRDRFLTCDLTAEYVRINAEYTT